MTATDAPPPSHAQAAAEMLKHGEVLLLHYLLGELAGDTAYYLLNQQMEATSCWQFDDGGQVYWESATGCYHFVSPDGAARTLYAGTHKALPFLTTRYMAQQILKLAAAEAAAEAGANPGASDEPPLSVAEAMRLCPELNEYITEALEGYELPEHIISQLENDVNDLADETRSRLRPERWQAIVAATAERLRTQP